MAEAILNQAGSANSSMRLKITYTNGNGNITITSIAGGRDSYGPTIDYGSNTYVYCNIGGTTYTLTPSYDGSQKIYFGKNYNYATFWSGSQSKSCEGNQTVTFTFGSSSGAANIVNSVFTTTIDAGYANPTLSVSGAGSSESNKVTIGTSGANVSLVVGNTGGRTCILKLNGVDTYTTYNSNGTKTFALPATLLSQHSGDNNFYVTVQLYTGSLYSEVKYIYIHVNDNIKPTISSFTISAVNTINAFGTNFIQGISKASISFTASGAGGSSISSYIIENIGGFNAGLFPHPITSSSYTTTNTFANEGTYTATGTVTDTRQRPSTTATTAQYTVIPYSPPSVLSTVKRCDSDGTLNNDGECCKLTLNYTFSPINNGSTDLNTKSIEYSLDGNNWTSVTLSTWSGEKVIVITSQTFDVDSQYNIYIRYSDRINSNSVTKVLEKAFVLISRLAGNVGDGVTLGRVATEPGFNVYLDTDFKGNVTKNGQPIGGGVSGDTLPIGSVIQYNGSSVPTGYTQVSTTGSFWINSIAVNSTAKTYSSTQWNVPDSGIYIIGGVVTLNYYGESGRELYFKVENSSGGTLTGVGGVINSYAWGKTETFFFITTLGAGEVLKFCCTNSITAKQWAFSGGTFYYARIG